MFSAWTKFKFQPVHIEIQGKAWLTVNRIHDLRRMRTRDLPIVTSLDLETDQNLSCNWAGSAFLCWPSISETESSITAFTQLQTRQNH